MPHTRPSLTLDRAHQLAAAAFDSDTDDLVGIEVEWPVHRCGRPQVRPAMADLTPVLDMALPFDGRVTVEPGGQIELSTAARPDAAAAIAALDADAIVLHSRLRETGLCPTVLAFDDRRPPARILQQPRYAAMEAFFAHRGDAGTQMMTNTASVQINISNDPRGGYQRWQVANRIGPLLIAAFANSPGLGRDGRRWQSRRQEIWSYIDPARTAPVPLSASPPQDWARYALAADVFFVNTGPSGMALAPGLSFGAWITNGHALGWPTRADLAYHITTLFPPIRPRGWLELRMLDALPPDARDAAVHVVCAAMIPAVATDLLARLPDTRHLWLTAARAGLAHPSLRAGARMLIDTTAGHLQQSTGGADAAQIVNAFADRYTRRGLAPADDHPNHDATAHKAPAPMIAPPDHLLPDFVDGELAMHGSPRGSTHLPQHPTATRSHPPSRPAPPAGPGSAEVFP
jgi:glutamate--cysteine ligase